MTGATIHTYIDKDGVERTEKVYPVDYLMNCTSPSEQEIHDFYETASIYLSFVIGMFKHCNVSNNTDEILKICASNPRYMYEYKWSNQQRYEYENKMKKAMMTCMGMTEDEAEHEVEIFSTFGGAFSMENYDDLYEDYVEKMRSFSDIEI